MSALLAVLLILVPAPKIEPERPHLIVGIWSIDWTFNFGSTFRQTTFFYDNGECWSPEYEGGKWEEDQEGYIWFQERNGKNQYVMKPDWESGTSPLWSVQQDGTLYVSAHLKFWRGEYLHHIPPREIE